MRHFTRDHLFILPRAEEYRQFYGVSIGDILTCLNAPDTNEGLTTERFTAEKTIRDHRLYLYYYLTLPLQATDTEYFAIIDFIGYSAADEQRSRKEAVNEPTVPSPQG